MNGCRAFAKCSAALTEHFNMWLSLCWRIEQQLSLHDNNNRANEDPKKGTQIGRSVIMAREMDGCSTSKCRQLYESLSYWRLLLIPLTYIVSCLPPSAFVQRCTFPFSPETRPSYLVASLVDLLGAIPHPLQTLTPDTLTLQTQRIRLHMCIWRTTNCV